MFQSNLLPLSETLVLAKLLGDCLVQSSVLQTYVVKSVHN